MTDGPIVTIGIGLPIDDQQQKQHWNHFFLFSPKCTQCMLMEWMKNTPTHTQRTTPTHI